MMGYMTVICECICGSVFSAHPDFVPSLRRTPDSPREPICKSCFNRWCKIHNQEPELHPLAYSAKEVN